MYTVVIVRPEQRLNGTYTTQAHAESVAAGYALTHGMTEAWIFGPDGKRVA